MTIRCTEFVLSSLHKHGPATSRQLARRSRGRFSGQECSKACGFLVSTERVAKLHQVVIRNGGRGCNRYWVYAFSQWSRVNGHAIWNAAPLLEALGMATLVKPARGRVVIRCGV